MLNLTEGENIHHPSKKHINKLTLQGKVVTEPEILDMKGSRTSLCKFLLQSRETYVSKGEQRSHYNVVEIEALGKWAEKAYRMIKKGSEYTIDGYLRTNSVTNTQGKTDNKTVVRVLYIDTM